MSLTKSNWTQHRRHIGKQPLTYSHLCMSNLKVLLWHACFWEVRGNRECQSKSSENLQILQLKTCHGWMISAYERQTRSTARSHITGGDPAQPLLVQLEHIVQNGFAQGHVGWHFGERSTDYIKMGSGGDEMPWERSQRDERGRTGCDDKKKVRGEDERNKNKWWWMCKRNVMSSVALRLKANVLFWQGEFQRNTLVLLATDPRLCCLSSLSWMEEKRSGWSEGVVDGWLIAR